ncbi:hypothetical protein SCUCBS95973_005680 [Sporothrix curviconia]|uniref:Traf-like signal protein n=1 Tax=Sporothrix curviconia TaxID=1260050 RepID=A0ABP0BZA4_9PEZI
MPPPNTPEEFFEEEYRLRRNSAVANAANGNRRRRFNLPPHDEDLAESEAELDLNSHPNTSQSESRRNSVDRRLSIDHGLVSRASSRSISSINSIPPPLRRDREAELVLGGNNASPSLSTVGPQQSDHEADYASYLRNPAFFDQRYGDEEEQADTPSTSAGAPLGAPLEDATRILSRSDDRQAQPPLGSELPAAVAETLHGITPSPPQATAATAQPETGASQPNQAPAARPHRKRVKTPKIDWHSLEYIGTYDENLDCPICRAPLVQPEITTCFHIFCHKCLVQSLRHENRCPIDRNPIQFFKTSQGRVPARPAPHIISNQLDNLQVRCPNTRCDYTAARSAIAHHYKVDCSFTKIPCPDPSCDKLVTRRDSEEGSCMHKVVDCVYCGKPVELAALDDHYDTDCNQKELMCEHCLAAVPRHRHGTHVMGCAERRIECKFRTSGCAYATKKKDFGDHERTCLYGMIMRLNRAHRADMNSMETVLQDSQDRVRKLEAEMAARPPPPIAQNTQQPMAPPPLPPQMYDYHATHAQLHAQVHAQAHPNFDRNDDLSSYYDAAAAGDALAHGSGGSGTQPGTQPGTPPPGGSGGAALARNAAAGAGGGGPEDSGDRMNRIVAYIDIFDAKVENLERYLGEVDARQAQMFMNELGPLKDQILEMRNSMGHLSMYVRWLMESFRQTTKRSVGLRGGGGGGEEGVAGGRPAGAGASSAVASAGVSSASAAPNGGPHGMPTVLRGPSAGMVMPARRMSDRENPPRL